ncbi:MAG: hypothetical protein WBV94_02775 [Blastocatellia bacterium]
MTELLTALAIILIIFVAINVRYVFKLRAAKLKLEREIALYSAAATNLNRARRLYFFFTDHKRADQRSRVRLN